MASILVTGGAGYIGSHTVHFLRKSGHEVTVVDNLSRGYRANVLPELLNVIDLRETDKLTALLKARRCEAVIHFAAYISVGESTKAPELYFTNNVAGSASLFEAMENAGVKKLVFSSTAAAYGTPQRVPIPETEPSLPINPYGESKVMVEKMIEILDQYRGFRSIRLRYFNACGAEPEAGLGERHDPETHLIPLVLQAVLTGDPVTVFGTDYDTPDGTCIRDYIHVSDLAEAHVLAVEYLLKGGAANVFNVGTGEGHSVKEILDTAKRVTGQEVPRKFGARREGDPAQLVADASKLKATLGWNPKRAQLDRIVGDAWGFARRLVEERAAKA